MFQAGRYFHRGGDGQKDQREGHDVVGGDQQSGGRPQAGQGDDGGHDQQVLAPGHGQAEEDEQDQQRGGGPGGDGVEMEGGFPQQRTENQHRGEAVDRGFEASAAGVRAAQNSQKMA